MPGFQGPKWWQWHQELQQLSLEHAHAVLMPRLHLKSKYLPATEESMVESLSISAGG